MIRRVVVTGIGVIVPGAVGAERFWRDNASGRSHQRHEQSMVDIGLDSHVVASIDDFDLADHHAGADLAELSTLSRFVQITLTAGQMAAVDAHLDRGDFDPERAGTILSSAIGGTPEFQRAFEEGSQMGTVPLAPFPPEHRLYDTVFLNYPTNWLSRRFGLRGPVTNLTTGCTAGIDSLGLGFDLVRHGELDLVLTGSGEAPLSGLTYSTLDVIGALCVGDVPPELSSRPFDSLRSGFVLSEGAATLVLEEYEHAMRRGATVYAEVLGFASTNNAFHMSDLAPDGRSMAVAMSGALRDAGVAPTDIDYVNVHGSSTPQNDVFEARALSEVLGADHVTATPISSTKSMLGHSLASASLVATVATIGALRHSVVPPTANHEFPDPACAHLDCVPNRARRHEVATAMVTASGFGGIHSCAVLSRVGEPDRDWWSPRPPAARVALPGGPVLVGEPASPAPETPVALFLHGFGATAAHWEPLLECVDADLRAIAVDLPGHGDNPLPSDATREEVRQYLLGVLDDLGVTGPVRVVGHSLGGLTALDLALAHPERIDRLAVIGTGQRVRLIPGLVERLGSGAEADEFLAAAVRHPDALGGARARRLIVDGFHAVRCQDPETDVWGVLGHQAPVERVRVPSLVLVPSSDRVVSPRKSRALGEALPLGEAVTLADADHYVHLERPHQVWWALQDFLTAEPAPRLPIPDSREARDHVGVG